MPRGLRFIVYCLSLIVTGLLVGHGALAQPWPGPIQSIKDKGVTIVKQFDAPGGLTGFAARAGNRPIALYLTPDGQHVIVGTMLDAQGNNVTQSTLDDLVSAPEREASWPQLEQSHWIADGPDDADRVIYVFTDPNCPYCHKFYEDARPWVEAGRVQLRHIPVGILKPSSARKAAALLGADDPEAAMRRHEENYQSGGIEPLENLPQRLRQQVAGNNRLMSRFGIRGTPGIVYRNDNGHIAVKQGVPQGDARNNVLGPRPKE